MSNKVITFVISVLVIISCGLALRCNQLEVQYSEAKQELNEVTADFKEVRENLRQTTEEKDKLEIIVENLEEYFGVYDQ